VPASSSAEREPAAGIGRVCDLTVGRSVDTIVRVVWGPLLRREFGFHFTE
jgi:hypothetical protein